MKTIGLKNQQVSMKEQNHDSRWVWCDWKDWLAPLEEIGMLRSGREEVQGFVGFGVFSF